MASSSTPSAPTLHEDALPSYEEAISIETPLNPVGFCSVHYIGGSGGMKTSAYNGVAFPTYLPTPRLRMSFLGGDEEEDPETALLKAELQRLRQENIEAKKQLLRQEIENERKKRGSSQDVSNYGSYPTPSTAYPQPPAVTSVCQVPEPVEETQEPTMSSGATKGSCKCVNMVIATVAFVATIVLIAYARPVVDDEDCCDSDNVFVVVGILVILAFIGLMCYTTLSK